MPAGPEEAEGPSTFQHDGLAPVACLRPHTQENGCDNGNVWVCSVQQGAASHPRSEPLEMWPLQLNNRIIHFIPFPLISSSAVAGDSQIGQHSFRI